jgi:ribosomal protein S27E
MKPKYKRLRFLLRLYYQSKFHFDFHFEGFDSNRTDPYFIVGNHVSLLDGLYTFLPIEMYAFPVINVFQYTSRLMEFLLTKVIETIPKRKGQSDITTIRAMMDAMKKGNGVLLYPEGNSSYFGKESVVPFSTAKFLKKIKYDIVLCKVNGGYLSAPRWADHHVKKGLFDVTYSILFTKEELETLTIDEIYQRLSEQLAFNDFEYNKERKYVYKTNKRALGLERFIYWCPKCQRSQTIHTQGNDIHCNHCGKIAHFNSYSLLEGLEFDSLVPWGELQLQQIPQIIKNDIYTTGKVNITNLSNYRNQFIGTFQVKLSNHQLIFSNRKETFVLNVSQIKGLVLTKKDGLSFDYLDKVYYIFVKDPMLFLNAIDYLNGGNTNG